MKMGKTKVSVTIRSDLLDEIDELARSSGRSALFEQALTAWVRSRRREALDRSIEAYYQSLGREDAAEDRAWAGLGDETMHSRWHRT